MTYLSRLATLGLAKEAQQGTWLAPTTSLPFTKAGFTDEITQIKDESMRGNDTVLQGLYQGTWHSAFDIDTWFYPDICGHFLRAMIGPDTVTAGISTTLSANTLAGATSITTAASIPAGSKIQIQDTGGANLEYAITGAPTGTGPYTIPITTPAGGLQFPHTSPSCTVVTQSSHVFKQNRTFSTVWPTYSLTVNDGVETRGYPGCVMSDLGIKIDPKGIVGFTTKFVGWPGATQTPFTFAPSKASPLIGWQWQMTNAGGAATRGLTYDVTLKRTAEPIHSSVGVQAPREIFPGALEADGTYKAIYENQLDLNLYLNAVQSPTTANLVQPISAGGATLALTLSQSGYSKGAVELGGTYVQGSFSLSGIANTVDAGVMQATLTNYVSTAY